MASHALRPDPVIPIPLPGGGGGVTLSTLRDLLQVRRSYMDALPVAAAVLTIDETGRLREEIANALYERLDQSAEVVFDEMASRRKLLERATFIDELGVFLRGNEDFREFRWIDGTSVAARHFSVRVGRLQSIVASGPRCLLTLLDRTAEVQNEKSLRVELSTDSLTGLLNRSGFSEGVERGLACGEFAMDKLAILVVDIRRFGRINESVGALSGDELLITVARRLLGSLRKGDLIARIGANEFGVCMRLGDMDGEGIERLSARLGAVFETPFRLSDLEIRVDCALGYVVADADLDVDELVRRAQFAAKRAKGTGRVEGYQPLALDSARRRFTLETELRRAIEAERLDLAFQPIVSFADGRTESLEALARWTLDGQPVSPTQFIPVAEEAGLIVPLGRFAIERALATLAAWDRRAGSPLPVKVAVNLSPLQIVQDDVPGVVAEALARHGIRSSRLNVELTESAVVDDPDQAMRVMASLREQGVQLALDDFGTGYSNLAYLRRLPIDMLKIDKSFVSGMLEDRDKAAIVRAILSLGQALGMRTTAEGIESAALGNALSALGCDRGQGYLYGVPLSSDEAFARLCPAS